MICTQNFTLNIAKAFILLNFRVAKVTFVSEIFDCRNCLTFDTDRLVAFDKLRTDP